MAGPLRYAAGGAVAIAAFLALPTGGWGQASVFLGLMTVSFGLLVRAVRRLPSERRRPGEVLLLGEAVYAVAWFARYLVGLGVGVSPSYPSVVDGAFFCAYALFGAFLFLLLAGGRVAREVGLGGVTLDALVATAAACALVQTFLVERVGEQEGPFTLAKAVSIAYPSFVILLFALGVQLVFRGVLQSPAGWLLAGWIGGELAADLWYSYASLDGSFSYGRPMFAGWMLSYVALGALALCPGLAQQPSTRVSRVLDPRRRLVALGVALAVPVTVLVVTSHPVGSWQRNTRAVWVAVVLVLVLVRLRGLMRDLALERGLRADIERLVAEREYAAMHDALTGLPNRVVFDERLGQALARRRREGRSAALLSMDIDSFKAVNDTYGHYVGDVVLRETAGRLRSLVREAGVVARLGGDEFAVVLDDADARSAVALAKRIVVMTAEAFVLAGVEIGSAISVGVHVPQPGEGVREVMPRADAALYAAKAAGGGFELFDPARHRCFLDRYALERELRVAAGRGELVLHYQPVVELDTRRTIGVEALVRWQHPTRGLLSPSAFIEVAEESGAIVEIGRWVIRQACADATSWQKRIPGAAHVGVAVNVSRRQLRNPGIVDDLSAALVASGLSPGSLTVEITETALMTDTEEMARLLRRFKELGVEIAMDDFGTGYSSLAQLRSLPIDVLKIDKTFVDGIAREDEEWALAAAIVRLAASLGKRTLAEGVESASQLAHLRALGSNLGQGYLFARPMPLAELEGALISSDVSC